MTLRGIAVSAGFAFGPVYRVAGPVDLPTDPSLTAPAEVEIGRAVAALASVAADLDRRAEGARQKEITEILRAQSLMAQDIQLRDRVAELVHSGLCAPHAIDRALAEYKDVFTAAGGYLAERAADLDDIRDRSVAVCLHQPMPGIPEPGHPYVLVARDLAPADTAGLDPDVVLALVTDEGGPTAHTAIVARTLGIPAVVRCAGVLEIPDGTPIAVDGTAGTVDVDPDPATVATARRREDDRRTRLARSSGPGRTADGHTVALLANIGTAADVTADGEGVGLFRTELLYLDRTEPPTVDEQVEAYAAVFAAVGPRRVVVRTLDAGADKPVPFLHRATEPNPALGVRGIRLGWRDPAVLDDQLKAIAVAADRAGAKDVWVMAPMVATPPEAARFRDRCQAAGLSRVGVMIEIPSAALQAPAVLSTVDFLSIGTNDLSQYTFAADRQCGELADLLDPWQPALLSLVAICGRAGHAAAKPIGVCGEAAADPLLAPVLVGLGVTSLSMAPRALPAVREALASHTLDECRRLAAEVLAAPDAATARAVMA
jgi:phosphoenolpyruvate-protein phosphotransferase (PTS system enzyme I)